MKSYPYPPTTFTYAGYCICVLSGPIGAWMSTLVEMDIGTDTCSPTGLILLILASPVLEEIIFRIGVHNYLSAALHSKPEPRPMLSLANLATSLLFGILHTVMHGSVIHMLTAIPALLIGWSWEASGNRITAPIFLHSWFNLCLILSCC